MNEVGIFDRTAYIDFINWNVIEDAYINDIVYVDRLGWKHKTQTFICLKLDHRAVVRLKGNRMVKEISKSMGF